MSFSKDVQNEVMAHIKNEKEEKFRIKSEIESCPTFIDEHFCPERPIKTEPIKPKPSHNTKPKITDSRFRCNICNGIFKRKTNLTQHRLIHEMNRPHFACYHCDKIYYAKTNIRNHLYKEHMNDETLLKHKCDNCTQRFTTKSNLQRHIHKVHSLLKKKLPQEEHICYHCNKSYRQKSSLRGHILKHHMNKKMLKHQCGVCGKQFFWGFDLRMHLAVHSNSKPFQCGQCPKNFKRSQSLRKHLGVHNRTEFICFHCEQVFYSKEMLKYHMLKMHMDVSRLGNVCPVCKRAFITKSGLRTHLISHSEAKPFVCEVCNRSFKSKFCMNKHQRVHEIKEKNYACIHCNHLYKEMDGLKCHLQGAHPETCLWERQCNICSKEFDTRAKFLKHYGSHSDLKLFTCKECPKSFKSVYSLRRHIEVNHDHKGDLLANFIKVELVEK